MLQQQISECRSLLPPRQRDSALSALARPILGWLGGAAIVEEEWKGGESAGAAAPLERSIARVVSYLCAAENAALVPCLMHLLRDAAESVEPQRRRALGLDTIARHCTDELAARLAPPPRSPEDWSVALPAGCDCALCRKLGAFLSDPAQQRLEWPLAKPGRQHVHNRIDHHELPVRHETRRSGSPYTLVLEKTKALFSHEAAARRAWQADLDWLFAGWTAPDASVR